MSMHALDPGVEALQRDVIDVDDRQAVEILETGTKGDELQDIGDDLHVDALAAGEFNEVKQLRVLLERQRNVEMIDALALRDIANLGQREGARIGAPDAQQVADRFHLILNLSAAVEKVFEERRRELVLPPDEEPAALTTASAYPQTSTPAPVTQQQQRRQRRLERYNEVVELFGKGYSQKAISRELSIQTKTIRRWLRAGQFPERKPPHRRPAKVTEFADYLQTRWNEGCHNASRLYHEIRQKGYTGKRSMVARFVSGWRTAGIPTDVQTPQRIAPKHAAILATRAADQVTEEQQKLFDRIAKQCPDAVPLRQLSIDFRDALSSSEAWRMQGWIELAKRCQFGAMVRFAYGLQKDIDAVNAAVETSWSTGQVEGQINRLKMIKRQMYGRAGFDLLRARVLPYAPAVLIACGPAP